MYVHTHYAGPHASNVFVSISVSSFVNGVAKVRQFQADNEFYFANCCFGVCHRHRKEKPKYMFVCRERV